MRPRIGGALALVASVVTSLGVAELYSRRHFDAQPFAKSTSALPHLTEKDRTLVWRFPPGDGRNSLGLRNSEVGPKPQGTFRILFLGDSLVDFGDTTDGRLYSQVVGENLGRHFGLLPTGIETINAGIPAYTTYQELEFLKLYGLSMEPDVVVLGFVLNDLFYKYLHRMTNLSRMPLEPETFLNQFDVRSGWGRLFARSYLAHWSVQAVRQRTTASYPFEARPDFYLAWKPFAWDSPRSLLGEMQGLLDARGIPLLVVVFPIIDQVDEALLARDRDYVLYPQGRLAALCGDLGLPFFDLAETIRSHGGAELFADDLHLNHEGNDVVAQELTLFLQVELADMGVAAPSRLEPASPAGAAVSIPQG